MRYASLTGTTRIGTVWSPGPLANSLWVLDDETGEPVVVKVPKGDVSAAHELGYATPALVDNPLSVNRLAWRQGRGDVPPADYRGVGRKLSEKVWRAAVGDQCAQLELDAA